MNKTFFKILALVLTLAMVIPFVTSCGEKTPKQETRPDSTTSSDGVETGKDSSGEEKIQPVLPEGADYGGYEFRIITSDTGDEWSVRDMGAEGITGDPINDAVYNRNKYVEEELKVKIKEIPAANAAELAKKSIAAGLDEYDMIVLPTTATSSLALSGYLYRLDELEYLDPTKPWWDKVSYDSLSIANAHFMIIGDIQIMDKDATWVQFFNKKMIEDYALESPYDLVNSGNWTIEKQIEMIKAVTDDTNGDGNYTKEDTFGMVSTGYSPMGYFYGSSEKIATKNADDIPVLSMNSPKISQVVNYINEICGKGSKIAYIGIPADVQVIFQEDRSLFLGEVLQLAERLRDMDTDFGIIPYPKFDKDQKDYCSVVHPITCVVSVPLTISDDERTGAVIEALCAESKYTLRKSYYDISLTTKFLRYDEGSSKMLDLIFGNRVYDLGLINDWGSYYTGFQSLFTTGSTDFASMYAKNESKAIKAIDQVVKKYMETVK